MSEIEKKKGYEFFTISRLNIDACRDYTDIGAMGFMVASWLAAFYAPIGLALADGTDPLAVSKHRTYAYEGKIYLQISTSLVIDQFEVFGLDTEYKVHSVLDKLANPACGRPLIKIHLFGDKVARCSLRAMYPTENLTKLVVNNSHIEKNELYDKEEELSTPPEPEEEYTPSQVFLDFVRDTKHIPALAKCHVEKVRGGGYTKDAMTADSILNSFLNGTFIARYGSKFTVPITQTQLDTITYSEIVEAVTMYTYAQAPSFSTALLHFDRKYSPVVNQYLKGKPAVKASTPVEAPTKVTKGLFPANIEELPTDLRVFYGGSFSEGVRTGFNDCITKKTFGKFYTHFDINDERLYIMYYKFKEYWDDMEEQLLKGGGKKLTLGRILSAYIGYLKWQKDEYVDKTLDNDVTYMKMGNTQNGNFKSFAIYAASQENYFISVNPALNQYLRDAKRGKEIATMQDTINLIITARDMQY